MAFSGSADGSDGPVAETGTMSTTTDGTSAEHAEKRNLEHLARIADERLRLAKRELQRLKAMSEDDRRIRGVGKEARDEVQALLLTCIAAGLAVAKIRELAAAGAVKEESKMINGSDNLTDSIELSLPAIGEKERYHAWWIVPKIKVTRPAE